MQDNTANDRNGAVCKYTRNWKEGGAVVERDEELKGRGSTSGLDISSWCRYTNVGSRRLTMLYAFRPHRTIRTECLHVKKAFDEFANSFVQTWSKQNEMTIYIKISSREVSKVREACATALSKVETFEVVESLKERHQSPSTPRREANGAGGNGVTSKDKTLLRFKKNIFL